MKQIKTTFVNRTNPFTGERKTNKKVEISDLQVCDDELPASRVWTRHKYDAMFEAMRPGQCVRCESAEVGTVVRAMRNWLKRTGRLKTHMTRQVSHYAKDGKGRVWLLNASPEKLH